MNCVFGRRGKMMGFGQTVDLKLVEIIKVKGRKIMGWERTVYLEKEKKMWTVYLEEEENW